MASQESCDALNLWLARPEAVYRGHGHSGGVRNENAACCRDVDMSETTRGTAATMSDDQELTEAEIEALEREDCLADPAVSAEEYPQLF